MDDFSKIKYSIRRMAGKTGGVFTAKVVGTDGETCTVEYEGAQFTDVRLRSVINGNENRILITPKTGSYVLAVDLSNGNMENISVLTFSEVERIEVKTGETSLKIDIDGVAFNGGKLNGLVKVDDMVKWMEKVYNDLTALKAQLASTPVAGQGAPLGLVFNMTVPMPATKDFANEKIKQ